MAKAFLVTLFLFCIVDTLHAQNYSTALGLRLSSNDATVKNGISIKHFLNKTVALEGLLSFDPLAADVLAEVHQPVGSTPGLRWLFGGGAFMRFSDEIGIGAQGIIGTDYKFSKIPLNVSLDWKPALEFTTGLRFEPAVVGLTARFTIE